MQTQQGGLVNKLFRGIFLLLNFFAIIWLIICSIASITEPAKVKYIALFSLTIPFAIIANVFFVFLWLFTSRKLRALLSAVTLIACYKVCLSVFGLHFFSKNDLASRPETIKIVSWNAHGMGIYNRPRNKEFDKRLLEFIKSQDADVLCLLEYPTPRASFMKPFTSKIVSNNNYKEFRFKDDNVLSKIVFLGTAVFSKYPFHNFMTYKLSEYIYMLQGDVQLPNGQLIRMFFMHLNTFGLSDHDKAYIEEVKEKGSGYLDSSSSYVAKLNRGFVRRSKETDIAAGIIEKSPYPVVICGDLNDLPGSYTYTKLRGNLNDAFVSKGVGIGRSYNQIMPTIRIDHMFYDPSALKIIGFDCPKTDLSDHNPLIANFEFLSNPQH